MAEQQLFLSGWDFEAAVMDGMAMTTFVKLFRWPAALSAIPVFDFYGLTPRGPFLCPALADGA